MIDFFDSCYKLVQDEKYYVLRKIKFYSVLRFLIRILANFAIPIYCTFTANNKKYILTSQKHRDKRVIISLTSFPARIHRIWLVIESLFRQSYKPDMIILWLSKEQFVNIDSLPSNLLKLRERGLQIILKDGDLRSHKKYFYTLSEYPNDIMITVDDDIFYPSSTIAELIKKSSAYAYPVVVARYFSTITWDANGNLLPYIQWKQFNDESINKIFFGSGGGTLFPPGVLYRDICNQKLFQSLTPFADDIWLNAMCRLQGTEIVATKHRSASLLPVLNLKDVTLADNNINNNLNDKQIESVREFYAKVGLDPFNK